MAGADLPGLLMIHGYLSGPAAWRPVARLLEAEARTFVPAMPGYQGTPPPDAGYSLEGLADALEPIVERERPAYLLGHSMGGIVALALAARHPDRFVRVGVTGLPVYDGVEEAQAFIGRRGRSYRAFLGDIEGSHGRICRPLNASRYAWAPVARVSDRRMPFDVLTATFAHDPAAHAQGLQRIVFAGLVPGLAAKVTTPVVALHGDRDGSAPFEAAHAVARRHGWGFRVARDCTHQVVFRQPRGVARWARERLLAPEVANSRPQGDA